jgi:hypothetical protein
MSWLAFQAQDMKFGSLPPLPPDLRQWCHPFPLRGGARRRIAEMCADRFNRGGKITPAVPDAGARPMH